MAGDYELLPERTLRELAYRCGRGWSMRGDKVPVAMTYREQMSRIANYRIVVEMAFQYLRRGERMEDLRDGIWNHVCAEVGLFIKSLQQEATDGPHAQP